MKIGFIGAGRVAAGLAIAATAAGNTVAAVASRSRSSSDGLAVLVPDCTAKESGQQVVDLCDLVFLTVPDSAISQTCDGLVWREGQFVVHCSGATEVSALASAAEAGAFIGGFHPMQSFTDPTAAAASLAGCTITIEADPPLNETLEALAAALECPVNRLPPGKRALYHAAAGYGSQFINVMLAEVAAIWRGWGASDEDVVQAILPMIRGTLASIDGAGIAGGMPGPVSRGDVATIEAHVAALFELDRGALDFYASHCLRTVALAETAGQIDAATAARLRAVLGV